MHHRLFEQQRALEPWSSHAQALGLDVSSFEQCLVSGRHAPAIRKDMSEAQKAGATGTPAFVIARTDPADPRKARGIVFLKGAQPYARFKAEIEQALAALGK